MQASQNLINLLKTLEGCRLKAYQDSGKIWTIGFGSTTNVRKGMVITMEEAESRLKTDLIPREKWFTNWLSVNNIEVNQNQCLLSKMIKNNPNDKKIPTIWTATCTHDHLGHFLQGLVDRREKEVQLYFKNDLRN